MGAYWLARTFSPSIFHNALAVTDTSFGFDIAVAMIIANGTGASGSAAISMLLGSSS